MSLKWEVLQFYEIRAKKQSMVDIEIVLVELLNLAAVKKSNCQCLEVL